MSKATLYRHWPGKTTLITATLHATAPAVPSVQETTVVSLTDELRAMTAALHGPWGLAMRAPAIDIDRTTSPRMLRETFFDDYTARITSAISAGTPWAPWAVRLAVTATTGRWARGSLPMSDEEIRSLAREVTALPAVSSRSPSV